MRNFIAPKYNLTYYEFGDGVVSTYKGHCIRMGKNPTTTRHHIENGMEPEEALGITPEKGLDVHSFFYSGRYWPILDHVDQSEQEAVQEEAPTLRRYVASKPAVRQEEVESFDGYARRLLFDLRIDMSKNKSGIEESIALNKINFKQIQDKLGTILLVITLVLVTNLLVLAAVVLGW